MSRLGLGVVGFLALGAAACSTAPADDDVATTGANATSETTSGPLTPDPSFAGGGTLAMSGASTVLGAAARSDGAIAVVRNLAGAKPAAVVTIVKADGSASSDTPLPGIAQATVAAVLTHADGVVVAGTAQRFFLARIGADGAIDPKFKPDPLNIDVADAAVTKDGKIVLAGTLKTAAHGVVVRLLATGSIDTTFAGGQGAWIDDATGATGATHIAVDDKGDATFITVGANGTTALRLDGAGKLDATFGQGGRVTIAAAVQPKHGSALVANGDGTVTYVATSAADDTNVPFQLDAKGAVTAGAAVPGTILGATSSGLESYETSADACTLHIGETTTTLTAAQCQGSAPYATLADGRHAIAFTTPGADASTNAASVRVFAP